MDQVTTTTQVEEKPKRQLTEAQRLAFMKGREKRLANLAKKREEKLEAERANFENANMKTNSNLRRSFMTANSSLAECTRRSTN